MTAWIDTRVCQCKLTLMTRTDVLERVPPNRSVWPSPGAVLELFKPVTWFAPMWAFLCGAVSSGAALSSNWPLAIAGMALAGPLVCAASQAVNDWFDRRVDAINEPNRPIPSGRIPGRWGLYIAIAWSSASLAVSALLGPWVFGATLLALALAWAYSAPPLRLKMSGWWGPAAVALSYEGIAWFTGAAALARAFPAPLILAFAALYSFGAFGIMVLNDFKAIEGDRRMGVRSLPVELGVANAAGLACVIMAAPQALAVALLLALGAWVHAGLVAAALAAQLVLMRTLMRDPAGRAPWYNATGVLLYVIGMLISAHAIANAGGGAG